MAKPFLTEYDRTYQLTLLPPLHTHTHTDTHTPIALKMFSEPYTVQRGLIMLVQAALTLTFAIGSAMKTTDPPIKILLANGINEIRAGAMEQLPLIHHLPFTSLLHLPFLPRITGEKYMLERQNLPPNTCHLTQENTFYQKCQETRRYGSKSMILQPWAREGKVEHRTWMKSRGNLSLHSLRPPAANWTPKADQPWEDRHASSWSLTGEPDTADHLGGHPCPLSHKFPEPWGLILSLGPERRWDCSNLLWGQVSRTPGLPWWPAVILLSSSRGQLPKNMLVLRQKNKAPTLWLSGQ